MATALLCNVPQGLAPCRLEGRQHRQFSGLKFETLRFSEIMASAYESTRRQTQKNIIKFTIVYAGGPSIHTYRLLTVVRLCIVSEGSEFPEHAFLLFICITFYCTLTGGIDGRMEIRMQISDIIILL